MNAGLSASPSGSPRAETTAGTPEDEQYVIGADGTVLFVTTQGPANAPVVVLVHGLGLSS
jgi:alpha-beta hydrolase superfamily lysophospholipase